MHIHNITQDDDTVTAHGWITNKRDLGGIQFITVQERTATIQLTLHDDTTPEETLQTANNATTGDAITFTGTVQTTDKTQSGIEIHPEQLTIEATSEQPPIDENSTIDKRMDWRSLDLRTQRSQAIIHLQSTLIDAMRTYLLNNDYTQTFTPCLLGVASESGSDVFPLIYFDKEAYLRQDPQLHRQLTIAGGHTKIFDIGPAWRAEQSHTTTHLCEHRVCAVETAFINDEHDIIQLEQNLITHALTQLKQETQALNTLDTTINIPETPFPVIDFPDAQTLLQSQGYNVEQDFDSDAEQALYQHVKQQYGTDYYFINKFPFDAKPFYVMQDNDTPWARSVDLYYKDIELSSGGQREHRHSKLEQVTNERDIDVEWFTRFFKYGVPPHGGFALGIERLTQALLDIDNIRDCTLFPRDPERIQP